MIKFRNSKITKVIALVLVLVFSSQQVGLARVTDLRDSAGFEDYALAIAAGYLAGQAIPANATVTQIFVTTYLMPEVAKQAVKAMGLKGTAALVANAFISTLLVSSFNYGSSAIAETGSKAGGVLGKASEMLGKMFKGAVFKGALADAITAAVIALIVSQVKKMLKGCKVLAEAIGYWLAKQIGQRIRMALQKGFRVFSWYDPKRGPTVQEKPPEGGTVDVWVEGHYKQGDANQDGVVEDGEKVWVSGRTEKMSYDQAMEYQNKIFKQQSRYDDYRVAATVLLSLAGLKGEALILLSAGAGAWMAGGSVKEGLMRGAISAVLQWMSRRTKSPLHGAVFALGASSILEYVVIGRDQLGKEQGPEGAVKLVQGKKDYELFREVIASAVTNANANFYSFGRAAPDVYGTAHGREFGFRWTSGNDVFFLTRYADYAMDVQKNGLGVAMMTQFVNAYHSQAVNEFYKVVSGEIKNQFYVKRLREGYDRKLNDVYARVFQRAQELLARKGEVSAALLAEAGDADGDGAVQRDDLAARVSILKGEISESDAAIAGLQKEISGLEKDKATNAAALKPKKDELAKVTEGVVSAKAELFKLQQAGELLDWLDNFEALPANLQEARAQQARRELLPATLMHIGVTFDPVLVGLGAATLLGRDGARQEMATLAARTEQIDALLSKSTPGEESHEHGEATRQLRRDLGEYDRLTEERAVLQGSGGWQTLAAIHGEPYVSIAPEVERNMQGRVATVPLSPEVERERIKATPEYQVNLQERTERLTQAEKDKIRPDIEANIGKDEMPKITEKNPGISEAKLRQVLKDKVDEAVSRELNRPETQERISQQAADEAYRLTEPKVLADPQRGRLLGTAEYRGMVGGESYNLDRWQPTTTPTLPPVRPVTSGPIQTPGLPSVTPDRRPIPPPTLTPLTPIASSPIPAAGIPLPPKSSPPADITDTTGGGHYRDVAEFSQLLQDNTGATRTPDDVYKVNMGLIPETLEQGRIRPQTYADPAEGIKYTIYGSDRDLVVQAVPGDLGPGDTDYVGVYHKVAPEDPYYKYITSYPETATDSTGQTIGQYRQYMDGIIGNYVRGGGLSGLSDSQAAIAFVQDQPPNLFQERLDKAGVDPATQQKMRQDLGVGHLPTTQERRDLTRYRIRENLDTGRYEVWGDSGSGWKFERYAQPDEAGEFKYDIHSGSGTTASGAISAATGQTKPLSYAPSSEARQVAQEKALRILEIPAQATVDLSRTSLSPTITMSTDANPYSLEVIDGMLLAQAQQRTPNRGTFERPDKTETEFRRDTRNWAERNKIRIVITTKSINGNEGWGGASNLEEHIIRLRADYNNQTPGTFAHEVVHQLENTLNKSPMQPYGEALMYANATDHESELYRAVDYLTGKVLPQYNGGRLRESEFFAWIYGAMIATEYNKPLPFSVASMLSEQIVSELNSDSGGKYRAFASVLTSHYRKLGLYIPKALRRYKQ